MVGLLLVAVAAVVAVGDGFWAVGDGWLLVMVGCWLMVGCWFVGCW